jgi:hypothetical protein
VSKAVLWRATRAVQAPAIDAWAKVMQFKVKKKVVDDNNSEHEWRQWLVRRRGQTVKLLL